MPIHKARRMLTSVSSHPECVSMSDLILAVGFLALPAYAAMEVHRNADRATLAIGIHILLGGFAVVKFDLVSWALGGPSVTRLGTLA